MNPPPTPPRRGAGRLGQFPSWEGSGVGLLPAVHGEPPRPCVRALGPSTRPGKSKAPQGRRTPKPGGNARDCGERGSVLECGGPPPLSMGARTRNTYGSWKAPCQFYLVHCDLEAVGRVTPCAPQFGNAQAARRGLTRPTFRFMEGGTFR